MTAVTAVSDPMPALPVPFFSACAVHVWLGVDLATSVQAVLDSGHYVLGEQVRTFEQEFARYIGVPHALGVASGTDALSLALAALQVRPGQGVVTVANAGYYASLAITQHGAQPVYADVQPDRLTMCPQSLARVLAQRRVAAVVVTHLYGRMADMPALSALCRQADVPLIEDVAQAHGAMQQGRRAGAWGAVGCFSFYPTKNLGALGDGGAVVTQDDGLAQRLKALRQYGWQQRKYEVCLPAGRNSRLDEMQAAVLRAKLPRLDAANAARLAMARRYDAAFAGLPLQGAGQTTGDVAHLYVLRTPQREALRAHLLAQGVGCEVHYPVADHLQAVRTAFGADMDLPVTEQACAQVLSLPCYPGLSDEQQQRVIRAVHDFFDRQERKC